MMDWKEILYRQMCQVEDNIVSSDGTAKNAAIKLGAEWLTKQAEAQPQTLGLCLEYVSKHIVRRLWLMSRNGETPQTKKMLEDISRKMLEDLLFLDEELESKGIDIGDISVSIFEKITNERLKEREIV